MYWFWYFLFAAQPALLLLGISGALGEEAQKAAYDLSQVMGAALAGIILLGTLAYLGYQVLSGFGLIN
jgi:hypothetical protein